MAAIPTKGDNYQLVGRLKASSHSPPQEQLGPQAVPFPASTPSSGTGQVRESGSPICGRDRS